MPRTRVLPGPVPHLVIGGGKEGNLFLLNRDNMGKFNTANQVVQTLAFGQSIFATAAFWSNSLYLAGVSGHLKTYSFNTATRMFNPSAASQSPTSYGFPGASPTVSSSGTANGIVWAIDATTYGTPCCSNGPAILHAYEATNHSGTAHRLSPAATKPATPSSSPCPPLLMAKSISAHAPNSPSSAFCITRFSSFNKSHLRAAAAEKVILGARGMLFPSGENSLYFRAMNQPKILLRAFEQGRISRDQDQKSSVTLSRSRNSSRRRKRNGT